MDHKDDDWVKLDEGFYIVEESGSPHSTDHMSDQADSKYQEIKEAFEGNIEFVE